MSIPCRTPNVMPRDLYGYVEQPAMLIYVLKKIVGETEYNGKKREVSPISSMKREIIGVVKAVKAK